MALVEGFEPPDDFSSTVFKTVSFDLSDIQAYTIHFQIYGYLQNQVIFYSKIGGHLNQALK